MTLTPCVFAFDFSKIFLTGVWEQNAEYVRSSAPAAGFSFYAKGKVLAELEGNAFFEIFVDGNDIGFIETSARRFYELATLDTSLHLVEVFHRSESLPGDFKLYFVKANYDFKKVSKRFNRRIAFIGDSYTVGYGVEASAIDEGTPYEQTNSTKSYAFLLSRKLKADFRIFAFSGRGLVQNYGNISPEWTIQKLMSYTVPGMAPLGSGGAPLDTLWHPQVIVIFIGINDFQGDFSHPTEDEFVRTYRNLLHSLREKHAGVKFLLLSTRVWPKDVLTPAVQRVYSEELALGNTDLLFQTVQTENTALHGHPNKYSQEALSQTLLPVVARLGGMLSR